MTSRLINRRRSFANYTPFLGLGLSICDKLVNLMNGKLDVESDEGKGATFWFQIPLIEHPYHLSEERYAHLKEKFNANFTPNMTPEKPIAQEKPNSTFALYY